MIIDEYLKTVFLGPPPESGWPHDFQILTAHNPKRFASETENNAADTSLRKLLEQEQIFHFRITGCSADLSYQEAGWGIVGIEFERAIQIGRHYGQYALFDVRDGEVFVVSCDTLEERSIGLFEERLKAQNN